MDTNVRKVEVECHVCKKKANALFRPVSGRIAFADTGWSTQLGEFFCSSACLNLRMNELSRPIDFPVSIRNFGKAHWSLLAYVGSLDNSMIDSRRMSCNPARHFGKNNGHLWQDSYSTVLADGSTIVGHDDWDCLSDLEGAGLIFISVGSATLTRMGWLIEADLRYFKAKKGVYHKFGQYLFGTASEHAHEK